MQGVPTAFFCLISGDEHKGSSKVDLVLPLMGPLYSTYPKYRVLPCNIYCGMYLDLQVLIDKNFEMNESTNFVIFYMCF